MQRRLLKSYRHFEGLGFFFSKAKQLFAVSPCGSWHGVTLLTTCIFSLSFVCLFAHGICVGIFGRLHLEGTENRTEICGDFFENQPTRTDI
jgi:hypothetical protein